MGDELHPLLRIKDFAPYATKIKASGADAVITGNFSNDLTLLVKAAAKEVGFEGKFYTFYGNALGAPAAMGEAGIGRGCRGRLVAQRAHGASEAFYQAFRARYPETGRRLRAPAHAAAGRGAGASHRAGGSTEAKPWRRRWSGPNVSMAGRGGTMRAADHQFQQPLVVGVMDRQGARREV